MKKILYVVYLLVTIISLSSLAVFPCDYVEKLDEITYKNEKYILGVLVSGFHDKVYSIVIYKTELKYKKNELDYDQFIFQEYIMDENLFVESGKFIIESKRINIHFSNKETKEYNILEILL